MKAQFPYGTEKKKNLHCSIISLQEIETLEKFSQILIKYKALEASCDVKNIQMETKILHCQTQSIKNFHQHNFLKKSNHKPSSNLMHSKYVKKNYVLCDKNKLNRHLTNK